MAQHQPSPAQPSPIKNLSKKKATKAASRTIFFTQNPTSLQNQKTWCTSLQLMPKKKCYQVLEVLIQSDLKKILRALKQKNIVKQINKIYLHKANKKIRAQNKKKEMQELLELLYLLEQFFNTTKIKFEFIKLVVILYMFFKTMMRNLQNLQSDCISLEKQKYIHLLHHQFTFTLPNFLSLTAQLCNEWQNLKFQRIQTRFKQGAHFILAYFFRTKAYPRPRANRFCYQGTTNFVTINCYNRNSKIKENILKNSISF
eukprot:TRINITY_DN9966_c0_g1_i6.p1 TRINITY_DN9966_c0_g1~~TRINITY_DN9966_c0_g1_i6.p1  ORF type:complete len:257 (+),score=3.10 TRINITY_DN9966_c0_g1_i6:226-996(+)